MLLTIKKAMVRPEELSECTLFKFPFISTSGHPVIGIPYVLV
ncbi:hypothetical protein HBHAL_4100 [Halobacillus halophilus DSM 2266]|uniref:Uncharacterized protein n=1 Tax=Halobacillus halophilus (strain ATCC 35676 / DSM 2266 / JCM 20832 / KCTC 3685 / LMG 17431 / NBRC 102448 / NCIMB 2269) TaxID=866895 RepID=I0JQM2_HALH3|nr:hypothetical protein HBHAL_4100 [Halobacillus halophilus DSM 2266]